MTAKIFIDGAAGTTGLEIRERLAARADVQVVTLDNASRKDSAARAEALNAADIVILCLPDDASREAVSMISNPAVKVIDASTAFRVAADWVYGFAEMDPAQHARIAAAKRVSNPGCWPTGVIALLRPLIAAGLIPADYPLSVSGVSGYSGGGKAMIEEFEQAQSKHYVETVFRSYGLTLAHKHAPEMRLHSGLDHAPVFAPNVGRFYRGMLVDVPLQLWALPGVVKVGDLRGALAEAYLDTPLVQVANAEECAEIKTLDAELLRGRNDMKLYVFGNDDTQQVRLTALFDNLGKGAGGAAVQNMNILLGQDETTGLV